MSFTLSLIFALSYYRQASLFLANNFSLPRTISDALGFLLAAVVAEALLGILFEVVASKITVKVNKWASVSLKMVLGTLEGFVLVAFILLLIIALPLRPQIKKDVSDSKIGSVLIAKGASVERSLNAIFGNAVAETISYLTIEPDRKTSVILQTEVEVLTVDEAAEEQMLTLINFERRKAGVHDLAIRSEFVPVARAHATDMWERKYFSHYSPEGDDVGDRLGAQGINYFVAGENLALAPTVTIAHSGLMQSEGHRANILSTDFSRVGVGVIDNGIYGKMFVQIFTD
jgi:uncharacterized protein YkwD